MTSRPRGVLVGCMGGVWRLSHRARLRMLRAIAARQPYDLDQLGRYVGQLDDHVTDMTPAKAAERLEVLRDYP